MGMGRRRGMQDTLRVVVGGMPSRTVGGGGGGGRGGGGGGGGGGGLQDWTTADRW